MYALLGAAALALLPACPAAVADWSQDMAAFAREDAAHPSPPGVVLFIGSSSIRLWDTLAADFPGVPVRNRGFSGSQISDVLVHFDQLVHPPQPRLIVFYAGTNDLAGGKSPEQVAADFREFCARVHAALPAARALCLSAQINPVRWALREKFALLNPYFAAFCAADPQRLFVETNLPMLTPEGTTRPEFFGTTNCTCPRPGMPSGGACLLPGSRRNPPFHVRRILAADAPHSPAHG